MSVDDTMLCIIFLLPDHYQGPFDGKQHNLGIRKQTGSGKLNQRVWSAKGYLCNIL